VPVMIELYAPRGSIHARCFAATKRSARVAT